MPSLRVDMKRGGGYMGFAVGVYETGLYVENVHPNLSIGNEFLQSENETIKICHSPNLVMYRILILLYFAIISGMKDHKMTVQCTLATL